MRCVDLYEVRDFPWWSEQLGLLASAAEGMGSIPDVGTKIPYATWRGQK